METYHPLSFKMLSLFFLNSRSEKFNINYDITPPLKVTNTGDYNIWSLTGAANNMKNSFHLSSRVNKTSGTICSRLPTTSNTWSAEMNITVGSGSLTFMNTQEVCPFKQLELHHYWNGFAINFEETDGQLNVTMIKVNSLNKYSNKSLCSIPKTNVIVNVSVNNNVAMLKYKNDNGEYVECGSGNEYQTLLLGFFTLSSHPKGKTGGSDIFSYKMQFPESHKEEFDTKELEKISRKVIAPKKTLEKKFSLAENIRYSLPEEINPEKTLAYINSLLFAMNKSLSNTLGTKELNTLIEGTVKKRLAVVEKKISKRRTMLEDLSYNLKDINRNMKNDMTALKGNMFVSMEGVKNYAVNELKKFLAKAQEANTTLPNAANESAKDIQSMWVPFILYTVAIIELICYIIFFFHKKRVTDNFKKYD